MACLYPSEDLAYRPWEHIIEDRTVRQIAEVWQCGISKAQAYLCGRWPDRYPLTREMQDAVRVALEEGTI